VEIIMIKKTLLVGGLAALTIAAAADTVLAQQTQTPAPAPRAMRADTDGDSRISQAEFVGQRVERLTAADVNRDGSVSPDEMRSVAQARMAQRTDARFQRVDADRDGTISRAEFEALRPARPARMADRGQRAAARGPVSIAEVKARTDRAFARLDADSDGFVTLSERQSGMRAMREQRRERRTDRRAARQAQMQASPPAPASE